MLSLTLQPTDGARWRRRCRASSSSCACDRRRRPPLFRSYSLSGPPSSERYRISVKIEPNGAAGTYLSGRVRVGDVLDVSAPRGSFVLQPANGQSCCSARESARRRCWPCCTRWPRALGAGGLVAARRAQRQVSSVRRRGRAGWCSTWRAAAATSCTAAPRPPTAGPGLRRSRTSDHPHPRQAGRAAERRLLPVRAGRLHGDMTTGLAAWRRGQSHPHGAVRR